jgi:FkbM family methyltransferase
MESYSQNGQDKWVASLFSENHQGFFFEMGAGDGVTFSNTKMLEDEFGWTGLLVEPHPGLFMPLATSREHCLISDAVIDREEGEAEFWFRRGWISGIVSDDTKQGKQRYKAKLRRDRQRGAVKTVKTKTLAQLFEGFQVPSVIDYFSLDVEGAEWRILKDFPFDRWKFLSATIEAPNTNLQILMEKHGYVHVNTLGEDFCYIHPDIAKVR